MDNEALSLGYLSISLFSLLWPLFCWAWVTLEVIVYYYYYYYYSLFDLGQGPEKPPFRGERTNPQQHAATAEGQPAVGGLG